MTCRSSTCTARPVVRGCASRVVEQVREHPVEEHRIGLGHGVRLVDRRPPTRTSGQRWPTASISAVTTSTRSTGSGRACRTPASIRDMSRRLAISASRRSVSTSIVCRTASRVCRGHARRLGLEQVRDGGLDRRERAPEVVRHRGEQRLAHDVGLAEHLGLGRAHAAAGRARARARADRTNARRTRASGLRQRWALADEHEQSEVPAADATAGAARGPARGSAGLHAAQDRRPGRARRRPPHETARLRRSCTNSAPAVKPNVSRTPR